MWWQHLDLAAAINIEKKPHLRVKKDAVANNLTAVRTPGGDCVKNTAKAAFTISSIWY
ncbi:MAG: hypothetical protein GY796_29780 [Chloroflexi bacterium]|nr:hypothetical protein [Chloroflexota bacterium]